MSVKMMLGLLAVSTIAFNCRGEEAGDETKNNVENGSQTSDSKKNDTPAGYECPSASNELVDIITTPEQGLGLNLKMPNDLLSVAVGANETFASLKIARFEKAFTVSKNAGNYPQRLLRIEVEQLGPIASDPFTGANPPPYPPYGMGTSKPVDGSEASGSMDAGIMEIDGKSVMIFRKPGEYNAPFVIVRKVDSKFYQITVTASVLKAAPIVITDIAAKCPGTYDPIALAVIKSIVPQ